MGGHHLNCMQTLPVDPLVIYYFDIYLCLELFTFTI